MESFSGSISKWAKKTGISIDNAVKAIRIQIIGGVIYRSPVLDSGLVQSWIATTDIPTDESVDVPKNSVANPEAERSVAIKKAVSIAQKNTDAVFWLTNNKPYVRRIEYKGWSKTKAPQGMVRITLAELKNGMEKLIKDVRE